MEAEPDTSEQKEEEQEARAEQEHSGMDVDEEAGQEALENQSDLDQDKKNKGEEGMNDQSQQQTQDAKSFGVKGKEDEEPEKQEAGAGSTGEEEKSLAEQVAAAERLDIVEGSATGEESNGEASVFRHMMDKREEDRSALDKAEQEQVKEQVLPDDWQTTPPEEKEERLAKLEEEKGEKEKSKSSRKEGEEAAKEEVKAEGERPEGEGEFSQTFEVARGAESLAVRQEFAPVVVTGEGGAGAGEGEGILTGHRIEESPPRRCRCSCWSSPRGHSSPRRKG